MCDSGTPGAGLAGGGQCSSVSRILEDSDQKREYSAEEMPLPWPKPVEGLRVVSLNPLREDLTTAVSGY